MVAVTHSSPPLSATSVAPSPASGPMAAIVAATAARPARSRLARLAGVSPVHADDRPLYDDAIGESVVRHLLGRLPAGWSTTRVTTSSSRGCGAVHVVVGPGGVVAVTARHAPGRRVWAGDDRATVDGRSVPWSRDAAREARSLGHRLGSALPVGVEVVPILVVVGARRVTVRASGTRAVVLDAGSLRRHLLASPVVLAADDLAVVEEVVRAHAAETRRCPGEDAGPRFALLERAHRLALVTRTAWFATGAGAIVAAALWLSPLVELAG